MQTKEVGGKILFSIFTNRLKFCFKMKSLLVFILFVAFSLTITAQLKNKHVLIFTKNGKGYVHENIPLQYAAFQKLGIENGFPPILQATPHYSPTIISKNMMPSFFQIPTMMYLIPKNKDGFYALYTGRWRIHGYSFRIRYREKMEMV